MFYDFDPEKNHKLKAERGINFEDVIGLLEAGKLLDILEHHNEKKYPNQKMYVVNFEGYVYLVPFVHDGNNVFLKTIFPSRKATKLCLLEEDMGALI